MVFFILQEKTYIKSNAFLFCSYSIITSLFDQFRLAIEHGKLKNFHFSRSTRNFNLFLLDLSPVGGLLLQPKNMWKYLGFVFNRKTFFHWHIQFYSNKVFSTVKEMNMLGNSIRDLLLTTKNYSIECMFCQLHSIDYLYGILRMLYYYILSRN